LLRKIYESKFFFGVNFAPNYTKDLKLPGIGTTTLCLTYIFKCEGQKLKKASLAYTSYNHGVLSRINPFVPRIQNKWDAKCNTSGLPANMFGITYCITRDGLRAKPEEYVWKFIFYKRQF
jgi:hypothetical protein